MTAEYDVIVVGVGTVGAAACMHLAQRHVRVLGLDANSVPGEHGSSTGGTRAFRVCYYEHPDYVPLLMRSHALWSELEQMAGAKIRVSTKALYIGEAHSELVRGSRLAGERFGVDHETLDHDQLRARYPQFVLPPSFGAILEPFGAAILAQPAIGAAAELAMRDGAEIHGHESVLAWACEDDHVVVTTARATYRARHVVFCAGPWGPGLLAELGVEMSVTRQVMGWFWPSERPEQFELGAMPTFGLEGGDGPGLLYGFPMLASQGGFKVAIHAPMERSDPNAATRPPDAQDESALRTCLERWLPSANGPLLSLKTCLYTNTPDCHFVVDRHPACERATVISGLSGHGFKFAPVLGEIAADLALEGATTHAIDFLRLDRFAG